MTDIFISWSGERSRQVAEALRGWISHVLNAARPWLSCADIVKGARWSTDVAAQLERSKLGIICVTSENVNSNWLLFESGALSKSVGDSFVCPYLFGIEPSDVGGPLSQFQMARANRDETSRLLGTMNAALGEGARSGVELSEAFDMLWPTLEEKLKAIPATQEPQKPSRGDREILDEILELLRSQVRTEVSRPFRISNLRSTVKTGPKVIPPWRNDQAVQAALNILKAGLPNATFSQSTTKDGEELRVFEKGILRFTIEVPSEATLFEAIKQAEDALNEFLDNSRS